MNFLDTTDSPTLRDFAERHRIVLNRGWDAVDLGEPILRFHRELVDLARDYPGLERGLFALLGASPGFGPTLRRHDLTSLPRFLNGWPIQLERALKKLIPPREPLGIYTFWPLALSPLLLPIWLWSGYVGFAGAIVAILMLYLLAQFAWARVFNLACRTLDVVCFCCLLFVASAGPVAIKGKTVDGVHYWVDRNRETQVTPGWFRMALLIENLLCMTLLASFAGQSLSAAALKVRTEAHLAAMSKHETL